MFITDREKESERMAKMALQYLPHDPQIYINLANTLGKQSRYKESEQNFKKAIELNSKEANYKAHANLGKRLCKFINNFTIYKTGVQYDFISFGLFFNRCTISSLGETFRGREALQNSNPIGTKWRNTGKPADVVQKNGESCLMLFVVE